MDAPGAALRFAHAQWPYEPKFKQVNGWRMHYVDEGSGDPVVLLHGNPAWGFLEMQRTGGVSCRSFLSLSP